MTDYKIRQVTIQEKIDTNTGLPVKSYVTVGASQEKKSETISSSQTEKVYDKLGDSLLFVQEYLK